jgi:transketolase
MRVVVPSDASQTREVTRAVAAEDGPFYVRLVRSSTCLIYDRPVGFQLGKAARVRQGDDVTIMCMGPLLWEGIKAAEALAQEGIEARVIDMASVKPIDADEIDRAARETAGIVSVEDHILNGGLGSAIAQTASARTPVKMKMIGIDDRFGQSGSPGGLYVEYGLTRDNIVSQAKALLEDR